LDFAEIAALGRLKLSGFQALDAALRLGEPLGTFEQAVEHWRKKPWLAYQAMRIRGRVPDRAFAERCRAIADAMDEKFGEDEPSARLRSSYKSFFTGAAEDVSDALVWSQRAAAAPDTRAALRIVVPLCSGSWGIDSGMEEYPTVIWAREELYRLSCIDPQAAVEVLAETTFSKWGDDQRARDVAESAMWKQRANDSDGCMREWVAGFMAEPACILWADHEPGRTFRASRTPLRRPRPGCAFNLINRIGQWCFAEG
jgi:hypothetical protein